MIMINYVAHYYKHGLLQITPLQESRPEIPSIEREKERFAPVFNYLLEEGGLHHHDSEIFIQWLEREEGTL